MKKFILSILAFCFPLFIADFFLSEKVKTANGHMLESWYDLMHSQIDADIVIMGNSRVWVHINPLVLDSILGSDSYNLGIDGSTVNRQIHKYNLFRRYNKKPKIIIQSIDAWCMGYGTGYEKEQLYPYFWNWYLRNEFFESEPFTAFEKYIPLYRYRSFLPLSSGPRCLVKGYQGMDRHWDGSKFEKIKDIKFAPNNITVKMFNDYLAKAKEEGIQVVLVYTPQYIGATKKTTNQAFMHEWYQQIANRYGFPILDYTYIDICKDTTFFYNAMHLNQKGAEIFSDSLANDLKKLLGYQLTNSNYHEKKCRIE